MAPSTPPPPDTSNAATTTTTTARPLLQNPPWPPPPNPQLFYSPPPSRIPSNPNLNYTQLAPRPLHHQDPSHLLYHRGSSGRGFFYRPQPMLSGGPSCRPPFISSYMDPRQINSGFVRPNHLPHMIPGSGPGSAGNASAAVVMPGVGTPVFSPHHPKVCPPSNSISDNGHNNLKNRDYTLTNVRNRKVRITENASLYTLCRSWLRNGFPEETQPQYMDTVNSLPRPLPVAAEALNSPDKAAADREEENEDNDSCEHSSEKELLQRHIQRAKRVRSRLREKRLQRITRYKTRFALLLPPMVEQHFKTESSDAN